MNGVGVVVGGTSVVMDRGRCGNAMGAGWIDNGERQIGVKPPPGFSQVVSAWFQLVSTGFGRA